ncbi:MAG TPA: cytochrome ubiquinol oxidase subunit I [Candidatus Hydrogenedentes bacterium]|nr:cytochrome ubiquinol oxidase subunit I [Candidatus Hydrogenedentota bacterium]
MNYPLWDVPVIGGMWVIGGIAIIHVMISHFAIGGGFYLPMAERKALREGRDDWMQVLRKHAKFFMVLTAVFGAVTGVGIWFSIGLANPEGTSTLIHNFVFGWAMEYAFFLAEITAAAVYYYTWGRVSDRLHLMIGWIYAGTAWMSLVIINGILAFMLTPGRAWLEVAGTGDEAARFWSAFFNPTYFPSLALRTLVCISLAGIWAFVTASRIDSYAQPRLKTEVLRWSVKWLIPSFVLLPFCFAWYLAMVPEQQLNLLELGISTIGQGTFTQVTRAALVTVMTSATIAAIAYLFAWRHPLDFNFGHACALLFLAFAATGATEYAREMLRKPYVVGDHMYSNGVRKSDVDRFNRDGYLTRSPWARPAERAGVAAVVTSGSQVEAAHLGRGWLMFRGQCMACHTIDGYRSMRRLLADRDREAIGSILTMLHEYKEDSTYRAYMPPLVGLPEEVDALGDYLATLTPKPGNT